MEKLVDLHGISKRYGDLPALEEVTLSIGEGITGLLGPNGAGKSTLIKILLGLVTPTSGTGTIFALPLGSHIREIRSRVGFMPEDDCFIPGLSGIESVAFAARLSSLPRLEGMRRAHEILDFCGMGSERYRTVDTYSTGMRQKLRFAQAIVHDPPLLILDEPTSGLDPDERELMLERLTSLAQIHGKAILLSTHILPDVQAVSDAVIILGNGKVRLADRMERLNRPARPAYDIQTVAAPDKLATFLSEQKLEIELKPRALVVTGESLDQIRPLIWQGARETGTDIRALAPVQNSLEEVFLQSVVSGNRVGEQDATL